MIRPTTIRTAVLLIAVVLGFGTGSAHAQSSTDVAAVTAANIAFYSALGALDAAAMEKVWAHEPYVTSIGPANKTVTTGWASLQEGYKSFVARMLRTSRLIRRYTSTGTSPGSSVGSLTNAQ
jgi:hypothetical protein